MRDYRVRTAPTDRPAAIEGSIKRALRAARKTFGDLLKETGASRSALAFHLKELYKRGVVAREENPKDLRLTYYSLTDAGRWELAKEELCSSIVEASNSKLVKPGSELEAEILRMLLRMVNENLMGRFRERISRTGESLSTEEKVGEVIKALDDPSIDRELRTSFMLYLALKTYEEIMREIEGQRLEREDAERLAKNFSDAFSFRIYGPLPIREDEELDNEMCRDAFNLLRKAVSKFSWSPKDLEMLKSLEKPKIILTIEYNLC